MPSLKDDLPAGNRTASTIPIDGAERSADRRTEDERPAPSLSGDSGIPRTAAEARATLQQETGRLDQRPAGAEPPRTPRTGLWAGIAVAAFVIALLIVVL